MREVAVVEGGGEGVAGGKSWRLARQLAKAEMALANCWRGKPS